MNKVLFFALSAMFCLGISAQDDGFENITDTIPNSIASSALVSPNSMLNMVQGFSPLSLSTATIKEQLYPLGKGLFKKHHIEQAIEICPNISKSKVSQSELLTSENADEIKDSGYGSSFSYTIIFIPGREDSGKLRLNKAGFAYSIGVMTSFSISDRYGTLCDFMAKVGIETCHNRKMGIGLDLLAGYGKSSGDVFYYKNIVEASEPSSIVPYTAWGKKFGGQIWLKTGLLENTLSNTDILLFARLVKAIDPQEMSKFSTFHHNFWREENWSFGVILRYRM